MAVVRFAAALLSVATAEDACSLRVSGFPQELGLNDNWLNSGGKGVPQPDGSVRRYVSYSLEGDRSRMLQFNATSTAWEFFHFDSSMAFNIIASCGTSACVDSQDLSTLPSSVSWELSSMVKAELAVGCCPHRPNTCHSCSNKDCSQYKTFVGCLAASAFSCCQAGGWLDTGACLCKSTAYECLPYDAGVSALTV